MKRGEDSREDDRSLTGRRGIWFGIGYSMYISNINITMNISIEYTV